MDTKLGWPAASAAEKEKPLVVRLTVALNLKPLLSVSEPDAASLKLVGLTAKSIVVAPRVTGPALKLPTAALNFIVAAAGLTSALMSTGVSTIEALKASEKPAG